MSKDTPSNDKTTLFANLLTQAGWPPAAAMALAQAKHPICDIYAYDKYGPKPMPRHACLAVVQALHAGVEAGFGGDEAAGNRIIESARRNVARWKAAGTLVHLVPIVSLQADDGLEHSPHGYRVPENKVQHVLRVVVELPAVPTYQQMQEMINGLDRASSWQHVFENLRTTTVTLRVFIDDPSVVPAIVQAFAALAGVPCLLTRRDDVRQGSGVRPADGVEQDEHCLMLGADLHHISMPCLPFIATAGPS